MILRTMFAAFSIPGRLLPASPPPLDHSGQTTWLKMIPPTSSKSPFTKMFIISQSALCLKFSIFCFKESLLCGDISKSLFLRSFFFLLGIMSKTQFPDGEGSDSHPLLCDVPASEAGHCTGTIDTPRL